MKDMLTHTHRETLTSSLYRTSLELLLIEMGCHDQVECLPEALLHTIATLSLVKSSILFLQDNNIILRHDISLTPPREKDCLIMKALIESGISIEDLTSSNKCRMYLKALYVSDITSGDGNYINDTAWEGVPDDYPERKKSWPTQGKPLRQEWTTCRLALQKTLIRKGRRLRVPLGKWRLDNSFW